MKKALITTLIKSNKDTNLMSKIKLLAIESSGYFSSIGGDVSSSCISLILKSANLENIRKGEKDSIYLDIDQFSTYSVKFTSFKKDGRFIEYNELCRDFHKTLENIISNKYSEIYKCNHTTTAISTNEIIDVKSIANELEIELSEKYQFQTEKITNNNISSHFKIDSGKQEDFIMWASKQNKELECTSIEAYCSSRMAQ